jgi:hypothetical protein
MSLLTHDARRTGGDAANQEGLSCGSLAAHDQDPSGAAWEGQWKGGAQHGENQHDGAAEEAEDDEDEEEEGVMAVFVFYYRIAGRA